MEQEKIQSHLLSMKVDIVSLHELTHVGSTRVELANVYDANITKSIEYDCLIIITSRSPNDQLYQSLLPNEAKLKTLKAMGDCHAPGTVAAAVFEGHLAARELEAEGDEYQALFRRVSSSSQDDPALFRNFAQG